MKNRWLRIAKKGFGLLLAGAIAAVNYSTPVRQIAALPDTVRIASDASADLPSGKHWLLGGSDTVAVRQSNDERLFQTGTEFVSYRLFGKIPLRTIAVIQSDAVQLIPGGEAVGITIRTEGVLVVGLGAVETASGPVSPAAAAGIEQGDWILSVDQAAVFSSAELSAAISDGGPATVEIERNGVRMTVLAHPVQETGGAFRLGAWVRDSTAGIGMLSFRDASTGWFAALGHSVSDIDTQQMLSVRDGRLVPSEIVDVVRGSEGVPGEMMGVFSSASLSLGSIRANTEFGIYGPASALYQEASEFLPMGYAFETHLGSATLLTTVSDKGVEAFSCEIIRVSAQDMPSTKGMIIEVTDARLLETTGGIVQGMSGSPVLQDGKLVGVVTHVFVNDPTRGYCIYAEWMYDKLLQSENGS